MDTARPAVAVRPGVLRRPSIGVRIQLGALVGLSAALRVLAAVGHSAPRIFPDEYIYAALGRSIGLHGALTIRGSAAHFPSLLEPVLAAPLWALAPTETAYRLVQVENAALMSLAAIPAYLLARQLRLPPAYALLCGAYAVATPDLVFSAAVLTDPVAYPIVLGSLCAAHAALVRPTRRSQVAFLALGTLATLARVQYVTLFAAFSVAALVLERRRAPRTYGIVATALATGAVGVLAVGQHRLLGSYSHVLHFHVTGATLRWVIVELFLLALASGAILVPGAVAGFLRSQGRSEIAFSLLVGALAAATLIEAAVIASNVVDQFEERYLFALLPLVPIGFGLYRRHGGAGRRLALAVAAGLIVALPLVPLSGYAAGTGASDSPFLSAVSRLEADVGVATGSLVVALAGSVAVAVGVLPTLRRRASVAVSIALALVSAASIATTVHDGALSRAVRTSFVAADPAWVDARHLGDVVALQTAGAPRAGLSEQLFWNTSIAREFLLRGARPTDGFATQVVRIARDGTLHTSSGSVRSPILFETYAVSATFGDAVMVEHHQTFELWKPVGTPHMRLLETGRYWDGWLSWRGRITVWPDSSGSMHGTLEFTVSLPRHRRAVDLRIGARRLRIRPGQERRLRIRLDGRGPRTLAFSARGGTLAFSARGGTLASDFRPISVRSTTPVFLSSSKEPLPTRR